MLVLSDLALVSRDHSFGIDYSCARHFLFVSCASWYLQARRLRDAVLGQNFCGVVALFNLPFLLLCLLTLGLQCKRVIIMVVLDDMNYKILPFLLRSCSAGWSSGLLFAQVACFVRRRKEVEALVIETSFRWDGSALPWVQDCGQGKLATICHRRLLNFQ